MNLLPCLHCILRNILAPLSLKYEGSVHVQITIFSATISIDVLLKSLAPSHFFSLLIYSNVKTYTLDIPMSHLSKKNPAHERSQLFVLIK